jgi:hypothetical protein
MIKSFLEICKYCKDKVSFINDVTQFWTFLTPSPNRHAFIAEALVIVDAKTLTPPHPLGRYVIYGRFLTYIDNVVDSCQKMRSLTYFNHRSDH